MNLKGQVAFITGGATGIGKAVTEQMARAGADVIVAYNSSATAVDYAARLASECGVRAMAVQVNVTSAESVASAFGEAARQMGKIDILVNNAGITKDGLLMRMKEEDWDAVIDTNLKSVFLCTKEAIKIMAKQRSGRIVNITSVVAFIGNAGQANYTASKAGIVGMTKTVAREYASRGITVNAVAPGFIQTAMTDALSQTVKDEMLKAIPLGKFGSPADVADAVIFLCSPAASYVTGQVIHVNGGMYM